MNEPMLDASSRLLVADTTVNTTLGTTNSSLSSIATNTGNAATSANQTNGSQQAKITDGTNPIFGTAAALADTTTNPTRGSVQVFPMGYNGSTWDRIHSLFPSSDAQGAQTGLYTIDEPYLFNGSTFDRMRSYGGSSAGLSTGVQANAIVGGLMPIGTKLNTYSVHLTTNTTTTPTASTAYISSIAISAEVGGTTSSVTIQDKSGTPLKLINGLATTAVTTTPTTLSFQTPVLMTGGIDIVTAGAVAGTVDVWVNYYQ